MSLPDYDGTRIVFNGETWGAGLRFTSAKEGRPDSFIVRDDWNEIEYYDAHLGQRYSPEVIEVDDGEVDSDGRELLE